MQSPSSDIFKGKKEKYLNVWFSGMIMAKRSDATVLPIPCLLPRMCRRTGVGDKQDLQHRLSGAGNGIVRLWWERPLCLKN
jgi:hypothetical protein